MDETYDRILGMLYGCAIGDSFAMPAEMWEPDRIKKELGIITDFIPGPVSNEISGSFRAGETTDDTIVAFICAAELIRTKGSIKPLDVVNAIERWSLENPKSKTIVGPSTRKAFEAIHKGLDVGVSGKNGVTNGAGTRVAPIGVLFDSSDSSQIARRAVDVCMATHNTSVAIAGASAIAAAVSHGIEGKNIRDMLSVVLSAAEKGSEYGYEKTDTDLPLRIKKSFERSDSLNDDSLFMKAQYEENGSSLPMLEACPTALSIAYRSGDEIMKAAYLAANMGGDTDTVAAMACMVIGAHIGASNIPPGAKELVASVNNHPFEETALKLAELRKQLLI